MNVTLPIETLREITQKLLSPQLDYSVVRNACASLAELFTGLTEFNQDAPETQRPVSSLSGHAISPVSAMYCITDMMRTRNFLQGIKDEISDQLCQHPGSPVKVLYAGTGPFATLLTPLITVFTPAQLQMILLEINPVSLGYLERLTEKLNMEPYIEEIIEADAAVYTLPVHLQPDILLSETMKPGLEKEPQVNITSRLLAQCRKETVLIPEAIKVDLMLTGDLLNNPEAKKTVQTLLELDTATALKINNEPESVPLINEGIQVVLEKRPASVFKQLTLGTTIRVRNDHQIGLNESGITLPKRLADLSSIDRFPATLLFQYRMGPDPGFYFSVHYPET